MPASLWLVRGPAVCFFASAKFDTSGENNCCFSLEIHCRRGRLHWLQQVLKKKKANYSAQRTCCQCVMTLSLIFKELGADVLCIKLRYFAYRTYNFIFEKLLRFVFVCFFKVLPGWRSSPLKSAVVHRWIWRHELINLGEMWLNTNMGKSRQLSPNLTT